MSLAEFTRLLWGTVVYRPYVYGFFACFLFFALRHLRPKATGAYLLIAYAIAYVCEFSATRNGFPFGMYVYIDTTRTRELWLSNIPFWDSLSFVFLSYFSWIAAASLLSPGRPSEALARPMAALLGGFLMMMLDVIIDPLTLLGERWFLGQIYYYPHGGSYFGVTLSNFAGWWFVGTLTMLVAQRVLDVGSFQPLTRKIVLGAWGVYAGVMAFNLAITAWIGEWPLFAASLGVAACVLWPSSRRLLASRAC